MSTDPSPETFIRRADTLDNRTFGRKAASMAAPDPIFEQDGKFFFYDETWTNAYGPFDTRESAQAGLRKYAESLG